MRLIDADALKSYLNEREYADMYYIEALFGIIDRQPTISPDEARGVWIDKPTGRYGQWQSWCSACGNKSGIGGIKSNRHKPYCPNCGAKMEVTSDE